MPDHDYFPSLENTHHQQVWLHENTINSAVGMMINEYLPLSVYQPSLSTQLMQAFPEFRMKCGADTNISLVIDATQDTKLPIKMTTDDGLTIGDVNTSTILLSMAVSNSTVQNLSVLQL